MLGLPILDVAIGMAFLYLLFALMCTTLNEVIAGALDKRAVLLREAIRGMVGDPTIADALYTHPAIASLAPSRNKKTALPSYIPADRFAHALIDRLTGQSPVNDPGAIEKGVRALPDEARNQLKPLLEFAGMNPAEFQKNVEEWYKQMMDRVNGWYKRYIQKQTWIIAAILVLLLNLDTIRLVERLWTDSALRATVVEQAKARLQSTGGTEVPLVEYTEGDKSEGGRPVQTGTTSLTDAEKETLSSLTGWQREFTAGAAMAQLAGDTFSNHLWGWTKWLGATIVQHVVGWLLTLIALSLGAPFWFDTLNRFMNIRNAGRSPVEPRSKTAGKAAEEAGNA
jgi:hypothetical protein